MPPSGVVTSPIRADNDFEFICQFPGAFRSLINYYQSSKSNEIFFRCKQNTITIFSTTCTKICKSVVIIDCSLIQRYFCEGEIILKFNLCDILKHFKSIDTTITSLEISHSVRKPDWCTITLIDASMSKRIVDEILLAKFATNDELFDAETTVNNILSNYIVKFDQTSKQFKKTINDISGQGSDVTIEKSFDSPLQFKYKSLS